MRRWIFTVGLLFSALICDGEVLGQNIAVNATKAKEDVEKYYSDHAILKKYDKDSNTWVDLTEKELAQYKNTPTYVISHGLNSGFDSDWINKSAKAIQGNNTDALIVSVNWDHFSGTSEDKNFAASTWINSVSPVLAKELGELTNIKSFIGHSYGTHLLADTMVKMDNSGNLGNNKISFVALDPAEETLTFTGKKDDGSATWMGSNNKKSKDWGLPENITTETYKSSGFLGSEERLGDYNYFLASEGTITPRAVLGDLDSGLTKNHSLAPEWFAEMMEKGHFGANNSGLIGGWFNAETDQSRGNRSSDYWDGVINATSSVNDKSPKLEYSARENQKFTEWQDLLNAEAQYLLHHDLSGNEKDDKSNWDGTVLKPSKYNGYKLVHGGENNDSTQDNVTVPSEKINDAVRQEIQQNPGIQLDSDNPLNNIPAITSDDPLEDISNTLEQEILKLKNKAATEEEKNLLQQAGEYIKEKIKEAYEKGEKWVEEGGIRNLILTQLDKNLTGKVSDADKQHILNMADKLCNINQDGGRSFAESLGKDGLPLLRSIAVQQLQKQISKALPKDVADNLNNYIQMLAIDGYDFLDPEAKQQLLNTIKAAISEYLPYENTAQTLNRIIQDIYDGNAGTVLDTIGQVGTSLGVDLLKDVLSKNLDPETAARINALLDAYAQGGLQGLSEAARAELFAMIDKVAPGTESAEAIKKLLDGIMNGTVTAPDFKNTATTIAGDVANKLIDQSNLSPEAKHAAKEAVEILKKNGITGITDAAQAFIQDYVTSKLGEEAGQAAADIFHAIVTPGEDVWSAIGKNLPVLGQAIGAKILAKVEAAAIKQIDKFIANHPALAKIAEILGIDGKGIVNAIKNVWGILQNATSLKDAFAKIGQSIVSGLKTLALNALKWGLDKLVGYLNNLIDKAVGWLKGKLDSWVAKVNNKLIQAGLSWLADQATKCAKCGAQKVVSKLSQKGYDWINDQRTNSVQRATGVIRTKIP